MENSSKKQGNIIAILGDGLPVRHDCLRDQPLLAHGRHSQKQLQRLRVSLAGGQLWQLWRLLSHGCSRRSAHHKIRLQEDGLDGPYRRHCRSASPVGQWVCRLRGLSHRRLHFRPLHVHAQHRGQSDAQPPRRRWQPWQPACTDRWSIQLRRCCLCLYSHGSPHRRRQQGQSLRSHAGSDDCPRHLHLRPCGHFLHQDPGAATAEA